MTTIGYLIAVLIGISLGLIGGGGSILTVPLLVYLFHIPPVQATSYSLFVVGATSLIGAYNSYKNGHARLTLALPLGIISPVTVFAVRRFWLPYIPEQLTMVGGWPVTKSMLTMILFALLMLAASISMLRSAPQQEVAPLRMKSFKEYAGLALFGICIGCITGFLGAGGGFLIIPALVLFLKLRMREAVGTSLLIVAINSLIGFTGDLGHYPIQWKLLLMLTGLAMIGIVIGGRLAKKIPAAKLRTGFGWFVLLMGIYIIVKELWLH